MDDMREIMEDFLVEAFEMNEQLDQDLVELEHTPQDLDLLNRIFRVAHTIKGSSSFLNLDTLTHLTHNMEDVLNRARKNELQITPDVMDVVLRSVDMMKTLLNTIRDTGSDENAGIDISGIVKELQAIAQSSPESAESAPPPSPQEPPKEATPPPAQQPATGPDNPLASEPEIDYTNMSPQEIEDEIERLLKIRQDADKARRAQKKRGGSHQ
ncbi:Hpt domain-containing protein, partial [Helicobacter sp. L8]|uniref:Hpt domain-containing protein n=1 Tax=Helicobacter sp. L8 TaxID=2316078 RepID=UPI001969A200